MRSLLLLVLASCGMLSSAMKPSRLKMPFKMPFKIPFKKGSKNPAGGFRQPLLPEQAVPVQQVFDDDWQRGGPRFPAPVVFPGEAGDSRRGSCCANCCLQCLEVVFERNVCCLGGCCCCFSILAILEVGGYWAWLASGGGAADPERFGVWSGCVEEVGGSLWDGTEGGLPVVGCPHYDLVSQGLSSRCGWSGSRST